MPAEQRVELTALNYLNFIKCLCVEGFSSRRTQANLSAADIMLYHTSALELEEEPCVLLFSLQNKDARLISFVLEKNPNLFKIFDEQINFSRKFDATFIQGCVKFYLSFFKSILNAVVSDKNLAFVLKETDWIQTLNRVVTNHLSVYVYKTFGVKSLCARRFAQAICPIFTNIFYGADLEKSQESIVDHYIKTAKNNLKLCVFPPETWAELLQQEKIFGALVMARDLEDKDQKTALLISLGLEENFNVDSAVALPIMSLVLKDMLGQLQYGYVNLFNQHASPKGVRTLLKISDEDPKEILDTFEKIVAQKNNNFSSALVLNRHHATRKVYAAVHTFFQEKSDNDPATLRGLYQCVSDAMLIRK